MENLIWDFFPLSLSKVQLCNSWLKYTESLSSISSWCIFGLNGFPPADNSVSPSLSTAALSQYCLIRPHGQKRVRLHSVNVNSQGWRTSLDTSWCIRAGVGLKLFGHEHYLRVDSHTGIDVEWGSWLMRLTAQTLEDLGALTLLLLPETP